MYKLSDFKKGQKAYIELTGNASRGKKLPEELIQECIIETVGRKYIIANNIKFEGHNVNYGGLKEHTEYCVNYVLYPNKQDILDRFEREKLLSDFKQLFVSFFGNKANELSLEKLRKIKEVIDSDI